MTDTKPKTKPLASKTIMRAASTQLATYVLCGIIVGQFLVGAYVIRGIIENQPSLSQTLDALNTFQKITTPLATAPARQSLQANPNPIQHKFTCADLPLRSAISNDDSAVLAKDFEDATNTSSDLQSYNFQKNCIAKRDGS